MSGQFLEYHARDGGCNVYCDGNRHAGIVYFSDELANDPEKALAFIRKPFPEVTRLVELVRAPEADHGNQGSTYTSWGVFIAHARPTNYLAYRYLVELEGAKVEQEEAQVEQEGEDGET